VSAFAIGGLLLVLSPASDVLVRHETPGALGLVVALVLIGLGVINWSSYIRADETSVVLGTVFTRRQCDRNELATITVNTAWADRSTRFIRRDGSVVLTTSGLLWGRAGLKSLADYLGVPLSW
jgi:hypothetical protein